MLVNKILTSGMVSKMSRIYTLINLLLLASIFIKLGQGKPALQPSWIPFRPIFGFYNQQFSPFWNPFNPLFLSKFQPPLTTNLPQLQPPPIFHHHKNILGLGSINTNKFTPVVVSSASNTEASIDLNNVTDTSISNTSTIVNNNKETHDIEPVFTIIDNVDIKVTNAKNISSNNSSSEILTTRNDVLLTPSPNDDNDIFSDLIKYFKKQIKQNKTLLEGIENNDNDRVEKQGKKYCEGNCEVTSLSPEDQVFAESRQELEVAEANIYRRKQKPVSFADDFYDYLSRQRKPENIIRDMNRYTNNMRVNSKRGQYRTTTSSYYDDYDFTTPRNRRRTTPRINSFRRRTTPSYEIDEYEDNNRPTRRRGSNDNRRATTPSYDDYYEDEYDYTNNRPQIRPRQEDTTDSDSTSTSTTTEGTTTTTTAGTTTTTTTTTASSLYPYPGSNANSNVSITYGPSVNHHAGYGPSNGNEHVSITYGPPTAPNFGPLLDSWYNQYTKSSVLKRIQELLTPNNYYSPQYEMDKYNNYDSVF